MCGILKQGDLSDAKADPRVMGKEPISRNLIIITSLCCLLLLGLYCTADFVTRESGLKSYIFSFAHFIGKEAIMQRVNSQREGWVRMDRPERLRWHALARKNRHGEGPIRVSRKGEPLDLWGNAIEIYVEIEKQKVVGVCVASSGKDQRFGTQDDIISRASGLSSTEVLLQPPDSKLKILTNGE